MNAGGKGIKIQLAGRSRRIGNGSSREADCRLDAAVDFAGENRLRVYVEAKTAQGHIGIQVWVNQGTYEGDMTDGVDAEAGQAPKKPKRSYKR